MAFIIVKSKYHEAIKSVQEKLLDRCEDARDECYYFIQEHPDSKHQKEVEKMADHLQEIIENYIK